MAYLSFKNISKSFPGVQALRNVSFDIEKGSCHALMGENGAGKSTLGKLLTGILTPDEGFIQINGAKAKLSNPIDARKQGIAMVHQELLFCPNLTVAENLCLGNPPHKNGWVQRSQMRTSARRLLDEIEANIEIDLLISELSTGQEQLVQIAAALGTKAEIIVMDEPTSSLSANESVKLFNLLGRLRQQGITIIYISHRLEEVFRLCDHITVLRDGQHVSTRKASETEAAHVIHEMVGRTIESDATPAVASATSKEVLRVENLTSPGKFRNISFNLQEGEILGMAGLIGAGRSEVASAIFGIDPHVTGRLFVSGREMPLRNVKAALRAGIGMVPEDRKKQGLILSMNCRENTGLASLGQISGKGFISSRKESDLAKHYVQELRIRTPSLESPVNNLSGGNQQKVALAKWLACHCDILIVDEPTRGVDVGAKQEIHHLLQDLAMSGKAILLISSELPELLRLSHRILVLRNGEIQGVTFQNEATQNRLMQWMTGYSGEDNQTRAEMRP